ncbi:hypothetical protein [Cellulomonas endophytica]|uniref:hypothetical protein n=1 Tax=Cellulomonas endophytica TaxID=2494735 RepID=UPI001013B347|nr:hypothetical protein [Cellulomonas endophytica]
MSSGWAAPTAIVIDTADRSWAGIWSLLYLVGKATFTLSLAVPLHQAVPLTFAALDLREARDELEWIYPELPHTCPAVTLGPLPIVLDDHEPRAVLLHALTAVTTRLTTLGQQNLTLEQRRCLDTTLAKVLSAETALASTASAPR